MGAHQSVLLQESIEGLAIKADGIYVDGTFGRGGHSRLILTNLNKAGRLLAIDKDHEAVAYAKEHFGHDHRFTIVQGSFSKLHEIAIQAGVYGRINGILLDLGVSSPQLDNPERGFSFMQQGPLDMRMDSNQEIDAAHFVNQAEEQEMALVFKQYGEERYARRIAHAIVHAREQSPILTTQALADIVKEANPKWEKHKHPATRVFQAIRIYINQELVDLREFLKQCIGSLAIGGRLVIISFHSLEDRLVKQFMRDEERGMQPPQGIPFKASELVTNFKRVGKAIKPSDDEVRNNVRARSAVLRIGEKIA
ncbi:16S rRNA (cytosine(1402)-N(4))-methyltransferase RsmH [Legionella oakridgensis]|uniref:Ribosomal RNA small subunit methyltransferase H n=2 Tax=Legionella oakridgensis TaxID=29423 RepID=W0BG43_9GAMM|nr:16S rRNA (cytosine(1402)-N(4))-methyltransferase RsmH [Legionella oakridgensis]AHE67671.1 S-adenosyl-methyltransferase MraW [Legionella oakridgensis ATCC 33761 = DSM 21215]ETO92766.1 S-adenosyl-methyltransferase MraW [Legionella oakridgensis RV-2-2007]KTD36995.1 S-adenosyl-methyltransferase MraW [Legionella oakridgensis]STY20696.1 S-adenosyl-dependent methyltransferase activity on membrane-located substrates [Legionella longbeachae]